MKILGEYLKSSGQADDVRAALDAAPDKEVRLPGFDLFSVGARSPYEWCVPKPRDDAQVVNVYEEYVDRPLGKVNAPERVAKRLYTDYRLAKVYFGPSPRKPAYWYTPAAKVLASAQHFGAHVQRRGRTLTTHLLGYTLMVSPMSCHSNLHRASMATPVVAVDFGPEELAVPALTTKHRLAAALVHVGVDESALWAANTAIRAELCGLVDTKGLFVCKAKALSDAEKRRRADQIRIAALEATEVAQSHREPVRALYEVMVPTLCSAQQFKLLFADPWQFPDRSPRPTTRTSWVTRIENLSTEATNALG